MDPRKTDFNHSVTGDRHTALYSEFTIEFTHMPTGHRVAFPAIVKQFNDKFESAWDVEEHYGRMDPVAKFKHTRREVNFTLDVVNDDAFEAANNLRKFQMLTRFLYPKYDSALEGKGAGAVTISSAPLIGIKFGNLIKTATNNGPLIGYVDMFSLTPDDDMGFWYALGMDNTSMAKRSINKNNAKEYAEAKANGWIDMEGNVGYETMPPSITDYHDVDGPVMLPKRFSLDCSFHVLHTHPVGWTSHNKWTVAAEDFPYGAENLTDALPPHLAEEVMVANHASYKSAKVPLAVENNLLSAIFGVSYAHNFTAADI